jgi:hypothetical protein
MPRFTVNITVKKDLRDANTVIIVVTEELKTLSPCLSVYPFLCSCTVVWSEKQAILQPSNLALQHNTGRDIRSCCHQATSQAVLQSALQNPRRVKRENRNCIAALATIVLQATSSKQPAN